jgi:quercetin dioxygenase-like cupin family protein
MRILRALPSRSIEHHGSVGFTHSRLARGDVQVSRIELDPGGRIGGHPAGSRQLFYVLRGRAQVRIETETDELGPGEAAVWEPGEWHETLSEQGVTAIVVEGDFELFVPDA